MLRVRLLGEPEDRVFGDSAVSEWDEHILQVVIDGGERWTFPLTSVAYFITEAAP